MPSSSLPVSMAFTGGTPGSSVAERWIASPQRLCAMRTLNVASPSAVVERLHQALWAPESACEQLVGALRSSAGRPQLAGLYCGPASRQLRPAIIPTYARISRYSMVSDRMYWWSCCLRGFVGGSLLHGCLREIIVRTAGGSCKCSDRNMLLRLNYLALAVTRAGLTPPDSSSLSSRPSSSHSQPLQSLGRSRWSTFVFLPAQVCSRVLVEQLAHGGAGRATAIS